MRTPIPDICLKNMPLFNRKEQRVIINTLLLMINSKVKRSCVVNVRIPSLGTIKTHKSKKNLNRIKYQKQKNKRHWRERKNEIDFSEQNLLF